MDERIDRGMVTSRRTMLRTGVAATGAAYVAPQILRTAVAGANSTTTYFFSVDQRGCVDNVVENVGVASCDSAFNGDIGNAVAAAMNPMFACPSTMGLVTVSGFGEAGTVTVGANATLVFLGVVADGNCVTGGTAGTANTMIAADAKSGSYFAGEGFTAGFITVGLAVTGS